MPDQLSRRSALKITAGTVAGLAFGCASTHKSANEIKGFEISLAQWSLHRELYAGEIDNLDFPTITRTRYQLGACEFVNSFFKDKANDYAYLSDLKGRADAEGVECLLIMCDGIGNLGDPDDAARTRAVEGHVPWLEAANRLGCHSIRVNAASSGSFGEQQKLAADGLRRLTELGAERELNVLVENHGGLSSNGAWLAGVMQMVDHPRCGTLPDFGNFCMDWSRQDDPDAWYDRYKGVEELMPYAKAVSAKSHEFNVEGDEVRTDYFRMLRIVTNAGYHGYVGIEWEGGDISEHEGVLATKRLLERVRNKMIA
ncbi:MAG: sugar phosphate isomerase/epimerase family protein [Planctomycetota bacterium]